MNLNGYGVKELREAVEKEKLTWRSFADPGVIGQGAITRSWNITTIPTLYLIDGTGVIRRKWTGSPGEAAIDAAIDGLLRGAAGK